MQNFSQIGEVPWTTLTLILQSVHLKYENLCILFLKLKYSIFIIHMGAALAELCLLDNKLDQHSQGGYVDHGRRHLIR